MRVHDHPADPVALAPLLRDTAAALEPQAKARNMRIDLQLDDSLPSVRGARDELMQVFQNLLDNGLQYGRAARPVEVRLSHQLGRASDRAQRRDEVES